MNPLRLIPAFRTSRSRMPAADRSISSPIDVASLLGRRPINLDTPELQRFLAGKRVLVTGAGGSIGSEIARQTMRFCPGQLILVDRAENALFEIDRELRERWVGGAVTPIVADVCDAPRVRQMFEQYQPQVIFHAAAHKHVPMMELNPGEAVKNNVFGTKIVADAALEFGATAFVLISTDKAVNPTSVMGATKRVAEMYVQSLNSCQWSVADGQKEFALTTHNRSLTTPSATRFLAVRFGNVLGSSGSVVPIFRQQIDAGGPVTVTHPDMKRYFMTIPEASQLVMQAGAIGKGGEIFILDMGQPVRILDLAMEMIRSRGMKPGRDIDIHYSGVRPGEKLYEELACDDEQTAPTSHETIRVWELSPTSAERMQAMLSTLSAIVDDRRDAVLSALSQCVAEYHPTGIAPPRAVPSRRPPVRLVTDDGDPQSAAAAA